MDQRRTLRRITTFRKDHENERAAFVFDDGRIVEVVVELAVSNTVPGLPGYVNFGGSKLVESPTFAGMSSTVIRDLSELNLIEKNGQTWARFSDMLYSPATAASPLNVEQKSVTIGTDGYNEWLKAGQDVVLDVKKPSGDRVLVFSPDGSTIYDSVLDSGKVFVPAGSLIELGGSTGHVFAVTATTPPPAK